MLLSALLAYDKGRIGLAVRHEGCVCTKGHHDRLSETLGLMYQGVKEGQFTPPDCRMKSVGYWFDLIFVTHELKLNRTCKRYNLEDTVVR